MMLRLYLCMKAIFLFFLFSKFVSIFLPPEKYDRRTLKWSLDRENNIVLLDVQCHPNTFFISL